MFEDGQLYSAVTTDADGQVQVHLGENHPGFTDAAYRARRGEIAGRGAGRRAPATRCRPSTTPTRSTASGASSRPSSRRSTRSTRTRSSSPPRRRSRCRPTTCPSSTRSPSACSPSPAGATKAAPGLVPLREFYADLGRAHVQLHAVPAAPEPAALHARAGHHPRGHRPREPLASPRFAAITEAAGRASERLETDEAMQFVADVFWFSIEFGVIAEDGETKAYGAGILSSYGEMDEFRHMDIRPLDLHAMGTLNYDITAYQPVLFRADSLDHLEDVVPVGSSSPCRTTTSRDAVAPLGARGRRTAV